MSSPIRADAAAGEAPPPDATADIDADVDMADDSAQQANAPAAINGASSSNPDQDMADSAPAVQSTQQNRKDATLREFMSKMDDYAPIVRRALHAQLGDY